MALWVLYYLYFTFQLILLFYAIIEFTLLIRFLFKKEKISKTLPEALPQVLIQLPIYNEQYVIERLVDAVCLLDYPKEKLHIQVLDDSTDETVQVVENLIEKYRAEGFTIEQVRREDRVGFKAGALAHGMQLSSAPFIAIFDADFIPDAHFLRATLPYFYENEKTGVVQTRWTHLNEKHSLLTRLQAIFLNTHFTVEQAGRSASGAFINFNGTAGIWRRTCIEESGGWQADTLTEDLDLSFRAQLKGWKFEYRADLQSPAELPVSLPAFKVQQYRWSKGAAECSRKNLGKLYGSKDLSLSAKLIGSFHLLNSSAYIVIFSFMILSLPMAYFFERHGENADPLGLLNYTYITSALLFLVFLGGNLKVSTNKWETALLFPFLFPLFLMLSMGISLYLMLGVIEGYIGKRSDFVRTPKFNITSNNGEWKNKKYAGIKLRPVFLLELLLLVYCSLSIFYTYQVGNNPLLIYEIMFTAGLSANILSNVATARK
jgi:cellulose synthase/poly-beta-1,6-N-acetylglucosamine synthase-like glycosyltransferase